MLAGLPPIIGLHAVIAPPIRGVRKLAQARGRVGGDGFAALSSVMLVGGETSVASHPVGGVTPAAGNAPLMTWAACASDVGVSGKGGHGEAGRRAAAVSASRIIGAVEAGPDDAGPGD